MSRFLLVCDPSYECSRTLAAALRGAGIDVGYIRPIAECQRAILKYGPDFVLLSPDCDPAPLDRLLQWMSREKGLADRARLFLIGNAPPHELADRWGWPKEQCLTLPLDEVRFPQLVAAEGTPLQEAAGAPFTVAARISTTRLQK